MGTRYRWAVLALGVLAQASFTTYSQGLASLGPVFRGQLGISLVSGLLCGLWIRTPPGAQAAGSAPGKRSPLADPRIWRLALGGSLLVAGQLTLVGYLVLFLNEQRHWALAAAAAVLAVIQFGGAGSRVLVGFWSDRRGERLGLMRQIALAGALTLAAVALLANAPAWLLVPLLLVTGIVSMSSNGLGFTATGEIAGRADRPAAVRVRLEPGGDLAGSFNQPGPLRPDRTVRCSLHGTLRHPPGRHRGTADDRGRRRPDDGDDHGLAAVPALGDRGRHR